MTFAGKVSMSAMKVPQFSALIIILRSTGQLSRRAGRAGRWWDGAMVHSRERYLRRSELAPLRRFDAALQQLRRRGSPGERTYCSFRNYGYRLRTSLRLAAIFRWATGGGGVLLT